MQTTHAMSYRRRSNLRLGLLASLAEMVDRWATAAHEHLVHAVVRGDVGRLHDQPHGVHTLRLYAGFHGIRANALKQALHDRHSARPTLLDLVLAMQNDLWRHPVLGEQSSAVLKHLQRCSLTRYVNNC